MTTVTPQTPKASKAPAPQAQEDEEDAAATAQRLQEEVAIGYATARIKVLPDGRVEKTIFINGEKIVQIEEDGKEKWNFA